VTRFARRGGEFIEVSSSDAGLREAMRSHYSKPRGFVGRRIIYEVRVDGTLYGYTSSNSATMNLPGRSRVFFAAQRYLNRIVNNGFFHVYRVDDQYPFRNFVDAVVEHWEKVSPLGWKDRYGDDVVGFETLVQIPRTGECYRRAGWRKVGLTKGHTCRRVAGKSTDSWSGRRVWSRGPRKWVFVKRIEKAMGEAAAGASPTIYRRIRRRDA
jgi:hypothetical protein